MSKARSIFLMFVGGAVAGCLLGFFAGGLLGTLYGAWGGDVTLGLDGAMLGGVALALLGALSAAVLELLDAIGPDRAPRAEAPADRSSADERKRSPARSKTVSR